jgi:hypothetical protein
MGWSIIEVKIVLLNIFSMISLGIRKAKYPFLDKRIFSIPET